MNYTIEKLQPEHVQELQSLFRRVYGIFPAVEYLDAKYSGPVKEFSMGWFGYMARYKGKPVGFIGAIPVSVVYNEKTELAAQFVDLMIVKSHRGKGLYGKLSELLIQDLQKSGVRFIWVLPNQLSEPAVVKKTGFKGQERFKGYVLYKSDNLLKKIARKMHLSTGRKLRKMIESLQTEEDFPGSPDPSENVCVKNDSTYFDYKKFTGSHIIRYKNALLWVKAGHDLLIGDIYAPDRESMRRALTEISQLAADAGARSVLLQEMPGTELAQVAESLAQSTFDSWLLCYYDLGTDLPLDRLRIRYADLDTF